jgi:hypothetical protein
MKRHCAAALLLVFAASLAGCASEILVKEIPNDLAAGSDVDGVPFRVPKRFLAVIYEKRDKGYFKLAELPLTLPDPDRLYVLNFKSQVFSNATIDIAANADNTLQQVSLKSAASGAAALTALGTQVNAVATAQQARKTASTTADTTSANLTIAADKAKQAADLALLQYQNLAAKPDTSAVDLLKAAQAARSAQLDANEAARLAGKPPYFPDIVP